MKKILLLTSVIVVVFHFIFMMAIVFGESLFVKSDRMPPPPPPREASAMGIDSTMMADEEFHFGPKLPGPGIPDVMMMRDRDRKGIDFMRVMMNAVLSFVMIFILFLYNRRIMGLSFRKKGYETFFIIMGSILITIVLSIVISLVTSFVGRPWPEPFIDYRHIRDGFLRDFSLMTIVIMVAQLVRVQYDNKMAAVENEVLRTENIRTHYETLKNQLDPHFLFNSLNTLQSLIELDRDKSESYIQELSVVLRYTLQNREVVTLAEEMKCVQAYCSMMQIRYGDNLRFDFAVDSKYLEYKVLPLSIQGLVENAIKHNTISSRQPLTVKIHTDAGNKLCVSNAIQPKVTAEEGSGIGLANLSERYRLKWNEKVIISDDGKEFSVTLQLKDKL